MKTLKTTLAAILMFVLLCSFFYSGHIAVGDFLENKTTKWLNVTAIEVMIVSVTIITCIIIGFMYDLVRRFENTKDK